MALPYEEDTGAFVVSLLHSRTLSHLMHLQTDSFSKHMALGEYYNGIGELIDTYVESYQGIYGIIRAYPEIYMGATEPISYFEGLQKFVNEAEVMLAPNSELKNTLDGIKDLINSTLYKLKNLK